MFMGDPHVAFTHDALDVTVQVPPQHETWGSPYTPGTWDHETHLAPAMSAASDICSHQSTPLQTDPK